jgi:hypothetical protein
LLDKILELSRQGLFVLIDPVFAFSRQDYAEDGAGGEVQGTAFAEDGAGTTRLRISLRAIRHVRYS